MPGVQQWSTRNVAPGVQVSTVTIRDAASAPFWTVSVQQPAAKAVTGAAAWAEVAPQPWADATLAQVQADGFQPRSESVQWPDYADTPHGLMGWRVRVGVYATQAAAKSAAAAITAAGFHAVAEWTGYDAQQSADVENVHVAVIDPRTFTGTVEATHDGDVTRRETTSSVAAALGSLVAVDGGFFVTADADGVQGTQSGLGVYGGRLESMAAGARGRLILVTVDGRLTNGSEGFTLYEAAQFMRSIGAVQALNLDGGGSTAMAVNGQLVNSTSDATGERAVGDTVQVLPDARG